MKRSKAFGICLACLFALFAGAFIVALIRFRSSVVLPGFALSWEVLTAFEALVEYGPAALFCALALSFSLYQDEGQETASLLASAILPGIILASILSALALILAPAMTETRLQYERLGTRYERALDRATLAIESKALDAAEEEINFCRGLDMSQARFIRLQEKLGAARIAMDDAASRLEAPVEGSPAPVEVEREESAADFFRSAQEAFDRKGFYEAHWLAIKATRLDPSRSDALRLAALAWKELERQPDAATEAEKAFYTRKTQAFALLVNGDPLGAYRLFTELSAEKATDPDVIRYLAEAKKSLEGAMFFVDEYVAASRRNSTDDFLARALLPNGDRLFLWADEVSFTGDAALFEGFEYMIVRGGAPSEGARTRYAKLAGRTLYLASSSAGGGTAFLPEAEGPSGSRLPPKTVIVDPFPLGNEEILVEASLRSGSGSSSLGLLSKGAWNGQSLGLDRRAVWLDLMAMLAYPFGALIAVVAGAMLGLRLRWPSTPLPRGYLLLAPLLALPALLGKEVLSRAVRLYGAFLLELKPGPEAFGWFMGACVGVLALSFLGMAGSRARK